MAKSSRRPAFEYKARTADQIKERANRKSGTFDSIFKPGIDPYKPKQGDNCFRYLPPTWDDADHYGYTIFVHNGIGQDNSTYLCPRKMLGKACPICEAARDAKDAGEADEEKALKAQERILSYVLDRDGDDPEKPAPYSQSWTQDRDVSALCINNRTGEILYIDNPDSGYDVSFKKIGTGLKTKYSSWAIDRSPSPIHESQKIQDEILAHVTENPIPSILNFFDYDYLKAVLSGSVEVPDKEADVDDADEVPFDAPAGRQRMASARRDPIDEVDPEENEELDDETPSRPHGRPASARHDDDVEDPPTRTVPRRVAPAADPEPAQRRASARRPIVEEDDVPPTRRAPPKR